MTGLILEQLLDLWPITLALLIAAWYAFARGGLPEDQQLRSLPSVLFLFPVLVVLWGAVAHLEFAARAAFPWRVIILGLIVVLHACTTAAVILVSRGFRRQTVWLSVLIGWVTIACVIQSTYALTGRLDPPAYAEAEQ